MEITSAPTKPVEPTEPTISAYKITITTDGMSVLMSNELVQKAFQNFMDNLLSDKSQYNNPVKKVIENIFSSYNATEANKEVKKAFDDMVSNQMKTYMTTPSFHLQLGQAMAEEMARRAVDKLNGK